MTDSPFDINTLCDITKIPDSVYVRQRVELLEEAVAIAKVIKPAAPHELPKQFELVREAYESALGMAIQATLMAYQQKTFRVALMYAAHTTIKSDDALQEFFDVTASPSISADAIISVIAQTRGPYPSFAEYRKDFDNKLAGKQQ